MIKNKIILKDSKIPWIGEIPEDWDVKKLKFVFKYITGATPDSGKNNYYNNGNNNWITISDLNGKYTSESKNKITDLAVKEKNMKVVPKGSLLYSFKLSVGQLAFVSNDTYTNEAIFGVLPLEGLNLNFWYYALGSYFISNANENIYGAKIFNQFIIDNGFLIIPSIKNQNIIANYLDQKTSQINTFIKNKKRLIELLEEQKISIINKAVTKGIDENVKMKDSGIPWIGEIPEDWEKWKISRIFKNIGSGTTPESGNKDYYENGTIKWVNTGDLNNSYLYDCEKSVTELALNKFSALKIFEENSLIIAMYGATIGKLGILQFKATTNQACCVLANSDISDIKYIYYWFLSNKEHIIRMGYGGGQPNISQDLIKSIKIPLPKLNIQINIVKYLDIEIGKINNAIQTIEKEIKLIEEYRDSLIYQSVTGKLNIQ